jgi:hypothetical protein
VIYVFMYIVGLILLISGVTVNDVFDATLLGYVSGMLIGICACRHWIRR